MVDETKDIAILTELEQKFAGFTAVLPHAEVEALQTTVANLKVEDDATYQQAAILGVRVASWIAQAEGFWDTWREFYFRRYKAIMAVTKDGITTCDKEGNTVHQLTGTASLAETRKQIEFLMRGYKLQRKQKANEQQAALNTMVEDNKTGIETQVRTLMMQGNIAEARKLRHEAENIHPVAILRQEVKLAGADVREPYKWSLEEDGLMKTIKAIAAGEVQLYHDIQVKGKPERRAIVELSSVVLNYRTRELGPDLHIPGIHVEQDVSFAFSKKTGTA